MATGSPKFRSLSGAWYFVPMPNLLEYQRRAWDQKVKEQDQWTVPVSPAQIAAARTGDWSVVLTPMRPVPREWFPPLEGTEVLCLASGGGQQAPLLAAAGARVTVLDNSPAQLEQDRQVALREGLSLTLEEGDMADLSRFADQSFSLIFHPVSNCFVENIGPVWRECARVLRPTGTLLAGFTLPVVFSLDPTLEKTGVLQLKYAIPYSDLTSLTDEDLRRYTDAGEPMWFGHSLEDQIGGQLAAGFSLTGFFEDRQPEGNALSRLMPGYAATRAVKNAR